MEAIVANLVGKVRRAFLNGRPHLVAPLRLIVPGVLNGSQGPLLYRIEDIRQTVQAWNHVPLTVYHPRVDGSHVTARSPEVLDAQGIGVILNAHANGALEAEGWFDEERVRNIDERVWNALVRGERIELSTGLFTDNQPEPGATPDGVNYQAIATNYRPDHVAILPDQKGACSLADGCGVLANQKQIKDQISTAIQSTFTQDHPFVDVVEVFEDSAIVQQGDELLKVNYTTSDSGITLSGEAPTRVRRKVEFVAANTEPEQKGGRDMSALTNEQKKPMVDFLIANCGSWKDEDRETLNAMPDAQLTSIHGLAAKSKQTEDALKEADTHVWNDTSGRWEKKPAKTTDKTPEPVTNVSKPMTADEWMAAAPPAVQSVVRNAIAVEQHEKSELIGQLTANVQGDEQKQKAAERLSALGIDALRDLAVLAPKPNHEPLANYFGQSAPFTSRGEPKKREPLELETIDWAETAKQNA